MLQRPFTPDLAVDLRLPSEPRLSPDGSLVAFAVSPAGHPTTGRNSTIYVAETDGTGAPQPLTGADHNNVSPRWSPDGRTIAFLSDRIVRGEAQAFVARIEGGEPLRLTDLAGGIANLHWSSTGQSIGFTATRHALARMPASTSEVRVASEQWRPQAVALVPALGGAPRLIGPAEGHVWSFAFSRDGERIAALVSPNEDLAARWDDLNLLVFDAGGENERNLGRFNGLGSLLSWSTDDRMLAFVGSRLPDAGNDRVFLVDTESGEIVALPDREMTPTVARFQGDDLIVHAVDGQRTRIDRTDPIGAEWERLSLGPRVDDGWIDRGPNLDITDRGAAFLVSAPTRAYDVYVARRGAPPVRVSDLNPQVEGVALADMRPLEWRGPDGLRIEGWLVLPPGHEERRPLPLIVEVHGGPSWQWGNWFHGTWHDMAQTLAARGYAVFLPNPRGSTGRGGSFTDANRHDFGGRDYDDVIAGLDLLVNEGIADPDRLGICGWSFGGFITAWAITRTHRFKAAVAGAAPTNWVSKIGTTDIGPFNEWNLGRVWDEPDKPWERSPIRYLRDVRTPTLIVHGEADKRVPVTQGIELYLGLGSAGVETELVTYPRQQHSFHERAFQIDVLERTCGWFDRFLG